MSGDVSVSAFRHADIRICVDAQLVLRAVGIDSYIEPTEHGYALFVASPDFAAAREQLSLYAKENANPPPPAPPPLPTFPWVRAVVAYGALIVAFVMIAERHVGGLDWYRAGRIDGAAVLAGQWWRLITALTLHADLSHLLANVVSGAVAVALTARLVGGGVAAVALLLSGTLGNAVNVLFQGPNHLAVGASTAIFAAVGLVGAIETRRHGLVSSNWAKRIGPLVFAVVLLTFFGTGSERTDVGAHWWGFVAGLVVGLGLGRIPVGSLTVQRQRRCAIAAGAVLVIAWLAALL
ncbi:MAG: rhomboid family intramembrane serine protease [Pseudomonadota bacterium]